MYFIGFASVPGLTLVALSVRPTEARSIRIICAFLMNDMGNPLWLSPKHLFLGLALVFALPATCPGILGVKTALECAAYSFECSSLFLCVTPCAMFLMPRALHRHFGSGPWRHDCRAL